MNTKRTHRPRRSWRTALTALGALACASLIACAGAKPKGQAQNTYLGGEGLELETRVGNRGLERDLKILRPIAERREGRLHVQFELHNAKTRDLSFEYAVAWRDASGFVVDTPWRWAPMTIVGQGFRTVSITGPTPEASQWELHVQKPNSSR